MTKQDYSPKQKIHDVEITPLQWHTQEDGTFSELIRLTDLDKVQFNISRINPGTVKAFHEHRRQTDWFMALDPLLIGLWDAREDSPTFGVIMRFMLHNQVLKINPGIVHGLANLTGCQATLLYAVDNFFDGTDELRHPWDSLGTKFFDMRRE